MRRKRPAPALEASFTLDTGTHHADIVQLSLTPDGRHLLSAGECTVRVWDLARQQLAHRLLGPVADRNEEAYGQGNVSAFAISPNGRWVVALKRWWEAAGEDNYNSVTAVELFELATGNLRRAFRLGHRLQSLAFSPDGHWLALTGHRTVAQVHQGELLLLRSADLLKGQGFTPAPALQTWPLARNAVQFHKGPLATAVRFVPQPPPRRGSARQTQQLVLAVQADSGDTLTWCSLDPSGSLQATAHRRCPQRLAAHTLAVSPTLAVVAGRDSPRPDGRQGQFVAYTHTGQWHSRTATDAPPAALAFNPLGTELVVGLGPTRMPIKKARRTGDIPISALVDAALPEHGPATPITVPSHGLVPEVGAHTVLTQVHTVGADAMPLRSSYFGHDGAVAALAVQADGTVWSSGGDNRAIHAWAPTHRTAHFLRALRGVGRICLQPGVNGREELLFGTLPARFAPPDYPPRQQRFDLRAMALHTVAPSVPQEDDFESEKWFLPAIKASQMIALYGSDAHGDAMRPDLTLFVAANDEWLLWSPSGYYNASPQGAQLAGYHISRGPGQEALFCPADRFKRCYQPKLIQAIVQHGSEARARAAGVSIPALNVLEMLPPIAEIDRASVQPGGTRATLVFTVHDLGGPDALTRVWIKANDRFVWEQRVPRRRARHRFTVTLPLREGDTTFTVLAESAAAKSVPVACTLTGRALPADTPLPQRTPGRLHLLSVGVSDFAVADTPDAAGMKRLKYAHRDAQAVHRAFGNASRNRAFASFDARLLVNAEATTAAVMDALRALCNGIQQRRASADAADERDVLLVFLSGHGVRYSGQTDLYFLTHDMVPTAAEPSGLSLIDVGQMMTSVDADVLLVIDACHAASAGDDVVTGLDPDELAQRIHALNERGLYVLSAARGSEKARESDVHRHGVFTAALMRALDIRQFHEPESPDQPQQAVLRAMGLMHALMSLVPQVGLAAGKRPQTPVCRTYGDLLPLVLHKA